MEKRQREIIALVLLAAIIVLLIGFGAFYLFAGHKWNEAASTIDDITGGMDGYVVVLYEGTDEPKPTSKTVFKTSAESTLSLADAKSSYADKGATIFSLHTANFQYSDTFVLLKNGYRIGFIPVNTETAYLTIDKQIAYLKKREVDVVVILEYSENEYAESVDGVDIIIQLGETPEELSEDAAVDADAEANVDDDAEFSVGSALTDSETADSVESLTEEQQLEINRQLEEDTLAKTLASGSSTTESTSDSQTSASSSTDTTSSKDKAADAEASESETTLKKSNAYVVDRRDRGTVAAILISPNYIVSAKTITD